MAPMAAAIRSFSSIRHSTTDWRHSVRGQWRALACAGVRGAVAGRALSLFGWAAMLAGVFRLARLPGAPLVAGWWAALLAAATPVYGGLHVEVRPDLIGLALQTWGVVLVLSSIRAWREGEPQIWLVSVLAPSVNTRQLMLGFACFALAGCAKQHLVVAPGVSVFLLLGARAQGRLGWKTIGGAVLLDAIILFSYYGFEEWLTAGRMSHAMFLGAREARVIHPSTWHNTRDFMLVLSWKCVGLILVMAAASLAAVPARAGLGRRVLSTAGSALVGLVAALSVVQIFAVTALVGRLIVLGLVVTMVCFAPACAGALRRAWQAGGIDVAFALYLVCELALTAYLVRQSTGAWYNYAVQGICFASILAGRGLARAALAAVPARAAVGMALAVLAVPAFALTDTKETLARRRVESFWLGKLFERVETNRGAVFFVDEPGFNRVHGRADLVYDPWLYPVFESIGLAEPRSDWLAAAIENGPIRVVVTGSAERRIDGISSDLPHMGYVFRLRIGPWLVWTRQPRQASADF